MSFDQDPSEQANISGADLAIMCDEMQTLKYQRDELLAALEGLVDATDPPPEKNCSCHISPPCNDCVDFSNLREVLSYAKEALAKAEANHG